ncbi:MAG: hypothetical protein H7A51_00640 [Akkermansiaceae bacterium]|nr:hypothetical protein [Akkermansiaceae bacterium]
MLLNFLVLLGTGCLRFFIAFDLHLSRLHIISGALLGICILFHLFDKSRNLRAILKPRNHPRAWLTPLVAAIVCSTVWAAAWYGAPGVSHLMSLSYEQRNHASIFRSQDSVAYRHDDRLIRTTKLTSSGASLDLELLWKSNPKGAAVAIWAETKSGTIIETLYLTNSLKYSEFHRWEGKDSRRGTILPVWRHRYTDVCGIDPAGTTDLISQPTINHQWLLDNALNEAKEAFILYVEINLPGDGSPSLIYAASIDPESTNPYTLLSLVGHSDGSEKDGELNYDISTLPNNCQIVERILVNTVWAK